MSGNVAVSLFVTNHEKCLAKAQFLPSVLLDVTEIVTANNDSALHLGGDDQSLQNRATNRDRGGERALLIDVLSLDGSLGGLDTKSHISVPALVGLLAHQMDLAVREHLLLLESSLILQICKKHNHPMNNEQHHNKTQNSIIRMLSLPNLLAPEYQPWFSKSNR